jgi:hypothetical protein
MYILSRMLRPIIWQTSLGESTSFEFEYLTKDLLADIPQKWIFDHGTYETVLDGAVIIYSCSEPKASKEFLAYLDRFIKNEFKFYLIHLSDEHGKHDTSYYTKATHVFRNYNCSHIKLPNVTLFPLGYKSGFRCRKLTNEKRPISACFIGQVKSDRHQLVNALRSLPDSYIHITQQWNCPTALNPTQVANIYLKTRFVPCPKGWVHVDSFRIFECLEWGAIPILRNYETSLGWLEDGHPIPLVSHWNEVPPLIATLTLDFDALQRKCIEWYATLKKKYAALISETIAGYEN